MPPVSDGFILIDPNSYQQVGMGINSSWPRCGRGRLDTNGSTRSAFLVVRLRGITKTRKNENTKEEGKPGKTAGSEALFFVFSFFRVFVMKFLPSSESLRMIGLRNPRFRLKEQP